MDLSFFELKKAKKTTVEFSGVLYKKTWLQTLYRGNILTGCAIDLELAQNETAIRTDL